jgi:carbamate kinase
MKDLAAPVVVALGGNAISPAGMEGNIAQQFAQTRQTAIALADLVQRDVPVIVTHGNGPQVGNAIRRVELSTPEVYPLDLGICVADVQGGMGYMIAQCIMNELQRRGQPRPVTTIVTTVEVDAGDPAFLNPTKPIGSYFDKAKAARYAEQYGWQMIEVPKHGWRRVVASPAPMAISEIDLIRRLVHDGEILVAVGGGGIPVYREPDGRLEGVEAVIDKDLASSLLAREIDAGTLFIVTAVEKVFVDYGTADERPIDHMSLDEARRYDEAGQFPPGSMGPKIQAAIEFLDQTERPDARVIIGDVAHMMQAVDDGAGTTITRHGQSPAE